MPFNQLTLFIIYFSAFSVLSVAKNYVNRCKSVKSVVKNQLVRRSLGEGGSIKMNKLCETNPIFKKVKCL